MSLHIPTYSYTRDSSSGVARHFLRSLRGHALGADVPDPSPLGLGEKDAPDPHCASLPLGLGEEDAPDLLSLGSDEADASDPLALGLGEANVSFASTWCYKLSMLGYRCWAIGAPSLSGPPSQPKARTFKGLISDQ
jgi:hypothetical protein